MTVTEQPPAEHDPRQGIGRGLRGDVLEIGPGHQPFPTDPAATVTYADRSVEGGRDATWPELAGQPRGPDAHVEVDLDRDGLGPCPDRSFDAVVAAHVVEHLADPLRALGEFERVLRPGGTLVLIVPDRARTFDAVRAPTPLAHVLDDFDRHVTEVDDDHIREFCTAIYGQPPIHPEEVRRWYDPSRLDADRMALHRRRTIHVHCWNPEEFAVLMAGALARGLVAWELDDLYLPDDPGSPPSNEFGLVLRRPPGPAPVGAASAADGSAAFVRRWTRLVLDHPGRDPRRVVTFLEAVVGALEGSEALSIGAGAVGAELVDTLVALGRTQWRERERIARLESELDRATVELVRQRQAPRTRRDGGVARRGRSWLVSGRRRRGS